ncbi:MAG: DNA internalization-related competence protein ComEC/Rec2 [Halioglobus sp.]
MRSWMIGVIVGLFAVSTIRVLPSLPTAACLFLAGLLILYYRKHGLLSGCVGGLVLGLALGVGYGHRLLNLRLPEFCSAMPVSVTGVVNSLPQHRQFAQGRRRQRFELSVDSVAPVQCQGPSRVLLSYYGEATILPGQLWRFVVRLKPPHGLANPGAFNVERWYAVEAIDATGNVRTRGSVLLENKVAGVSHYHNWRRRISEYIAGSELDAEASAVLQALAVADKNGMDYTLTRLFQAYGLSHLLVISGLHIGFIAGFGFLVGTGICRLMLLAGSTGAWFAPLVCALLAALGYSALAGFSLSTSRAVFMLGAALLATLLGRNSGSWNNLLLAAFVILLVNPLAGLGSGFWLSFGAVAWLLWLVCWSPRTSRWRQAATVHVWMALIMLPLGGWWFGGASIVAAVANFVAVPLIGLYVVPILLLAVSLGWFVPQAGDILLGLAALPVEALIGALRFGFEASGEQIFAMFSPGAVATVLAIIACLLLVITPMRRRCMPLIIVLGIPLFLPPSSGLTLDGKQARLTFLDVGQGTAVVLQDTQRTLVYDTGGGDPTGSNMASSVILPYLRNHGVIELDTLIVSHGDNDHSAGADTLRSTLKVNRLLYGQQDTPDEWRCRSGMAWRWPSGISFQVLSPAPGVNSSRNNSSCVLQVQIGEHLILLSGDIDHFQEKELVRYWRRALDVDWLLAPHHGSLSSNSLLWLKYVQPRAVVFSSGYANAFGHPHTEVMERYRSAGTRSFTTSTTGALEVYFSDSGEITSKPYRVIMSRYWNARVSAHEAGVGIMNPI